MSNTLNPDSNVLSYIAGAGASSGGSGAKRASASSGNSASWFEALARAWGDRLDAQATKIIQLSDSIGSSGNDSPSQIAMLTAESQRMAFISQSASSSQNSVAQALETMAKRQ